MFTPCRQHFGYAQRLDPPYRPVASLSVTANDLSDLGITEIHFWVSVFELFKHLKLSLFIRCRLSHLLLYPGNAKGPCQQC
jgi:hypothetical protein